jgi:hypothetical protein
MRDSLKIACTLLALLVAGSAAAQETRGTISGTVRDKDGVLPGANVKITNVDTSVSQQLVTNASGYFEAPLLIAGTYEVSVEMPSFKSFRQTGIQLAVGQSFRSSSPSTSAMCANAWTWSRRPCSSTPMRFPRV